VLWPRSPVRVVCPLTLAAVKRLHVVIPDDLHARLKARASLRGKTIQDYVEETLRAQVEEDEAEDRKSSRGR
jgi:plasmid stability protein